MGGGTAGTGGGLVATGDDMTGAGGGTIGWGGGGTDLGEAATGVGDRTALDARNRFLEGTACGGTATAEGAKAAAFSHCSAKEGSIGTAAACFRCGCCCSRDALTVA
jgi:hypothetical protein